MKFHFKGKVFLSLLISGLFVFTWVVLISSRPGSAKEAAGIQQIENVEGSNPTLFQAGPSRTQRLPSVTIDDEELILKPANYGASCSHAVQLVIDGCGDHLCCYGVFSPTCGCCKGNRQDGCDGWFDPW